MFDWLGDLFAGMGDFVGGIFNGVTSGISTAIFDMAMSWLYNVVYNAISEFFGLMGSMGADIFDLPWVEACVELFTLFGWALYAAGLVVAVFDVAIEYQNGRASPKTTALNILKGFFACSLIGVCMIRKTRH